MDELFEEDKLIVVRVRKIQKFLFQFFQVVEVFIGQEGKYVLFKEIIIGFERVFNGEYFVIEISVFILIIVDSLKKYQMICFKFFIFF